MTPKLPPKRSRPYKFLVELQAGPGTFWQICERVGIDLTPDIERDMRLSTSNMERYGLVRVDRITYHLTDLARAALSGAPAAEYVGQVAGPAFRGVTHLAPVTVVRRAAQAVRP